MRNAQDILRTMTPQSTNDGTQVDALPAHAVINMYVSNVKASTKQKSAHHDNKQRIEDNAE